jgi:hypothetical protein
LLSSGKTGSCFHVVNTHAREAIKAQRKRFVTPFHTRRVTHAWPDRRNTPRQAVWFICDVGLLSRATAGRVFFQFYSL